VLWPWGHALTPAPNADGLRAIGARLAAFNGYLACQAGPCLYQASGTTDDWAYGELGIPAFTFELGMEFMPPYAEIDADQWPRNGPALQYAARIARAPYLTVQGPEVTELATAVTPDGRLRLTATIDDRANGGDALAGAVYALNLPFWAAGAAPRPLTAVDGAFDSAVEEVTAVIDLDGAGPGPHTLFVRGQDAAGNWGAVRAVFVSGRAAGETVYLPLLRR
jgi:carboxypeptidase T